MRCLGLVGEFFVLEEKLGVRWGDAAETYVVIEICGNVCPKAKNGVLTPIIYIFYSKNSCKTAI